MPDSKDPDSEKKIDSPKCDIMICQFLVAQKEFKIIQEPFRGHAVLFTVRLYGIIEIIEKIEALYSISTCAVLE
jgi:hypothetical protein